jgi:hypothetical protein
MVIGGYGPVPTIAHAGTFCLQIARNLAGPTGAGRDQVWMSSGMAAA